MWTTTSMANNEIGAGAVSRSACDRNGMYAVTLTQGADIAEPTDIAEATEEREHGFTLIELLVVMIIIGILAAIAIPVFLNQRNSGYDTATRSDVRNGVSAEEAYFADNTAYTATTASLTGWSKSSSTQSVTFSLVGTTGYKIDGLSKSNKHFCYNSAQPGSGVIANGTAPCP